MAVPTPEDLFEEAPDVLTEEDLLSDESIFIVNMCCSAIHSSTHAHTHTLTQFSLFDGDQQLLSVAGRRDVIASTDRPTDDVDDDDEDVMTGNWESIFPSPLRSERCV